MIAAQQMNDLQPGVTEFLVRIFLTFLFAQPPEIFKPKRPEHGNPCFLGGFNSLDDLAIHLSSVCIQQKKLSTLDNVLLQGSCPTEQIVEMQQA